MRTLLFFFIIIVNCGCSNYFYKVKYSDPSFLYDSLKTSTISLTSDSVKKSTSILTTDLMNNKTINPSGSTVASISINNNYDYYIRKVFKKGPPGEKSFVSNSDINGSKNDLIEIEYLLISRKNGNVIYITMIQDKTQEFYSKHYLGDQYLNAYDFRNFLFGTIKRNIVTFVSKQNAETTEEWTLDLSNQNSIIYLTNILENKKGEFSQSLPVERALADKLGFEKIAAPTLVYHEPDDDNNSNILPSTDNKLYFSKIKNKWRIHLLFIKPPDGLIIYYKENRFPYTANSLFDY